MRIHRAIVLCLAPAAGIVFATAPARAARLTVEYSGEINLVIDPDNLLDPSIQLGVPFFGSFTYDTEGAVDLTPDEPEVGTYSFPYQLELHVGNTSIETSPYTMEVWNNEPPGSDFIRIGRTSFQAAGLFIDGVILTFSTDRPDFFASTLPPSHWHVNDFLVPRLDLIADGFDVEVLGVIETITVIPEPPGVLILAVGATLGLRLPSVRGGVGA